MLKKLIFNNSIRLVENDNIRTRNSSFLNLTSRIYFWIVCDGVNVLPKSKNLIETLIPYVHFK